MYDLEKLSWIIDERRKKFKLWISLYAAIFVSGVIVFFAGGEDIALFGVIAVIAAIFLTVKLWRKYSPGVLFSAEIRGENVKEHEFVQSVRGGYSMKRGIATRLTVSTHSNSGSAKSKRPHVRSAYVYVRLADGNVVILDGLTSLHTDIYEIGDEIMRPAGARYPIVLSRELEKQPCPLCGRINRMDSDECASCGLSIVKKKV